MLQKGNPSEGIKSMPIISRFFGILIFMFWREHEPPHFHAKYGDEEVVVEIENGKVSGTISKRALGLIQDWRELHKEELLRDWALAKERRELNRINPLE
jgi:Domain of unknown function (DUF4160)